MHYPLPWASLRPALPGSTASARANPILGWRFSFGFFCLSLLVRWMALVYIVGRGGPSSRIGPCHERPAQAGRLLQQRAQDIIARCGVKEPLPDGRAPPSLAQDTRLSGCFCLRGFEFRLFATTIIAALGRSMPEVLLLVQHRHPWRQCDLMRGSVSRATMCPCMMDTSPFYVPEIEWPGTYTILSSIYFGNRVDSCHCRRSDLGSETSAYPVRRIGPS